MEGKIGLNQLAKEYHLSKGDIQKWVAAYGYHGEQGLNTVTYTYDGNYKIYVVEYMQRTGASIRQTAAYFNIPSPPTVALWQRIYDSEGKEALYEERRGRANKMNSKKGKKPQKGKKEKEDMIDEIKRLRMENEYLKKLNALIQERGRSRDMKK